MSGSSEVGNVLRHLEPLRRDLAAHQLYNFLARRENVVLFMEQHVYAVWDFMTLLKAVQRHLTSIEAEWRPAGSAAIRRLVNEIVLEEESGEVDGTVMSQFELYRRAMRRAGANVEKIDCFIAEIERGSGLEVAIARSGAPTAVIPFLRATERVIATSQPHLIVATFALGWEDVVTTMFCPMLATIPEPEGLETFGCFLRRRINQIRQGRGALTIAMLGHLCGGDTARWREAGLAGIEALVARLAFWNAITEKLQHSLRDVPMRLTAMGQVIPD